MKVSSEHWQRLTAHPETRRFGKFAVVGLFNTIIDFSIYVFFTHVVGLLYLWANFIAYLVATLNSYLFNRRWTFRSTSAAWRPEMMKYFLVIGVGFLINEGLLYTLVEHFAMHSILAKVVVIGVVVFWNYGANRLWTFRKSLPV